MTEMPGRMETYTVTTDQAEAFADALRGVAKPSSSSASKRPNVAHLMRIAHEIAEDLQYGHPTPPEAESCPKK